MRRKDRETGREFALSVLDRCVYAVLATTAPDHTPYCVPITIVREGDVIYFHCAQRGQKTENLQNNAAVCLTAVCNARPVPESFTMEYESAVVSGIARELTAEDDKIAALRLLSQRHVPQGMAGFANEIKNSLRHTAVWRIEITSVTGKRNACGNAPSPV